MGALALTGYGGSTPNAAAAAVHGAPAMARLSAGTGTCALLALARAEPLMAKRYSSMTAAAIAPGVDQCTYHNPDGSDLVLIVYQPSCGVTFSMLVSALKGVGTVKLVKGLGDKAVVGAIELDVLSSWPRLRPDQVPARVPPGVKTPSPAQ